MRFFGIFLALLFASFTWATLEGIDLAARWIEEAEGPGTHEPHLDELELSAAHQRAVPVETTLEIEGAPDATPTRAPEAARTPSPLEPAHDFMAETPTEADITLDVSCETPPRNTAQPLRR